MTAVYRLDQGGNGTVRVWHCVAQEYILELPYSQGLVVLATYRNLAKQDQVRADDFMFGYQLGAVHTYITGVDGSGLTPSERLH